MSKYLFIRRIILSITGLLVCLSLKSQNVTAAPADYLFTRFSTADGLPSPEILSLAVDRKGFLWVGSAVGISRYDGYVFTHFTYAKDNTQLGVVHSIKQGQNDRLWIGSSAGLFCFTQGQIMRVNEVANNPQGVYDIVAGENGDLWLASQLGPLYLTEKDISFNAKVRLENFILSEWTNNYSKSSGSECQMIRQAKDGTIYFSQPYQLYKYSNQSIQAVYTASEHNDKMEELIPVSQSTVYFNSSETGLHKLSNNQHQNFQFKNLYQPQRIPRSAGHWYTGSLGIVCFHPEEEYISKNIKFQEEGAQWLTLVLKENSILWLATHSGLIKIKPVYFHVFSPSQFNEIQESFSVTELPAGQLLIGGNHGAIFSFDGQNVKQFLDPSQSIQHAEIKSLYEDKNGWLWMASGYEGIGVYRKGHSVWFTKEKETIHNNSFASVVPGKNGLLYAIGDKGATVIQTDTNGNISFTPLHAPAKFTQHAKYYDGIEGPDGKLWIGGDEGLSYLQKNSFTAFQLIEKPIQVRSIKKSHDGSVWIATTGEGILQCRFNRANTLELIKQYTKKDGLNSLQFLDLLLDKNGNLWAGSTRGLSFIDLQNPQNTRVINFTETDGFINPGYYSIKLFQDKKGFIWAGSSLGIARFDPNEIQQPASAPKVYLNVIDLLHTQKNKEDKTVLPIDKTASLPYYNNSLSFNYTALDPANQDGIIYYYRMEGLDTNWINGHDQRSISYFSLPPGKYSFNVKATNAKGVVSTNIASYSFIIHPPFWRTWWFIGLTALIGILIVMIGFRGRIRQLKAKSAIQQQLTELEVKALRAQMNPHFIFNAMSSIQQFTVNGDIDNAYLYISKFSTLLRKVLHSSQQNYISLEDEVEILSLYLEIEKQRLGKEFEYILIVEEDIETDAVKIPGMMIQPFVENAIKHGLALQEGSKKLEIRFSMNGDHQLCVRITDNGIGREKASELRAVQEKLLPHESKGIELVKTRLKLLQPGENNPQLIAIEDLYDDEKIACGTRVNIQLPIVNPL